MFKSDIERDKVARHPTELHYMRQLRYILRMICGWPQAVLGEKVKNLPLRNTRSLFVEGCFCGIGGLIYIKTHYNIVSFLELGHTFLTVFMSAVAAQRITVPWFKSYQQVMKEFVLEMHLFYHRNKTAFCEHMYQYIHRVCSVFVFVLLAQMAFGVILFSGTPLYNSYKKGMFSKDKPPGNRFEHSINYSLPFFNQYRNLPEYIVVAIINIFFAHDCALCFTAYDLTLSVIVFHIWGHLKILDNNLRSIPTPLEMRDQKPSHFEDGLSYTAEENVKIHVMLKNIVDHHRLIMGFMTRTSSAFGPTLCLYYMFHQVSGCILLLECAELDAPSLIRYGAMTITIFQLLIQMSIIVELLGSQSETLKDAVYSVPWEYMDTRNRKTVLFLLCNVQEPIRLKPMGMFSVGVQIMTTILKTSFSYFMLLRTFN